RLTTDPHRRGHRRGHARGHLEDRRRRLLPAGGRAVSAVDLQVDRSRFREIPRFGLFTEEHDALREAVRDWVQSELRPHTEEWERERDFPYRQVFREAAN